MSMQDGVFLEHRSVGGTPRVPTLSRAWETSRDAMPARVALLLFWIRGLVSRLLSSFGCALLERADLFLALGPVALLIAW
jgi:hypothetical protein